MIVYPLTLKRWGASPLDAQASSYEKSLEAH
jgi:hypothetical protein